jgi:probable F420-dependent oxidoreductase
MRQKNCNSTPKGRCRWISLRFGFCLPHDGELSKPDNLAELSRHAERVGFDTLVEPSDHIVMPNKIKTTYPYSTSGEYTDTTEDLDQATTLSFVAAKTEKIRLMTGIAVIPYRNPLVFSNSLATIDYLSKGRLEIGAGVGWMKEEFDLLHVPYDQRGEIMDEYLRILQIIWSEKVPHFSGKYFQFSDVHFSPKVVQQPHPPIWIGGESPRALRRAAELGNGWFPIDCNPRFPLSEVGQMRDAITKLRRKILKAGRQTGDVRIGYQASNFEMTDDFARKSKTFVGPPQKIASDIREFESLGVSFLAFSFLRDTVEKTKAYSERFANEVLGKL